ncbi:hypothetical protein [Agarilytica rhodophyticola]|uniref:hypothetical protein n=1 Tax=Agarilytica rhodophyticola TaxID=1737490 RepID=UPI000B3490EC|nr:hypothetical protein [Agarilytica rhodophyticola]
MKSDFYNTSSIVILQRNSSAAGLPCNAGGGSPSLLIACSRITGSIFIMPHCHYYRFCGMASMKPKSDSSGVRRRVDRSSSENPTKETPAALLTFCIVRFLLFKTLIASSITNKALVQNLYHLQIKKTQHKAQSEKSRCKTLPLIFNLFWLFYLKLLTRTNIPGRIIHV